MMYHNAWQIFNKNIKNKTKKFKVWIKKLIKLKKTENQTMIMKIIKEVCFIEDLLFIEIYDLKLKNFKSNKLFFVL